MAAKGCLPRSPTTAITRHVLFDDGPTDSNWILVSKPRLVAPFWNSYIYPWCYG